MDRPSFIFQLCRIWRNLRYRQPGPSAISTVADLCRDRNFSFSIIEPEHEIKRILPPPRDDGLDWHYAEEERSEAPATFYAELPDMYLVRNGYMFTEDGILLADAANEIGSTPQRHSLLRSGNLPYPKSITGRVAVLDVSHGYNYFHFLFDCLPRLTLLPQDKKPDFYYVRHNKKFQRQYLDLLGIEKEKIICAEENPVLKVEYLCLPSLPGVSGNPTRAAFDFLRGIKHSLRPSLQGKERKRRIYVSRGDVKSRLFANEEELQNLLRRYEFEIVELGGLSVAEQISLFDQSSVVVGPHGAGLSNLVYAEPGTTVIELLSADYFNVCYWAVSQLCGHHYYRVTSPPRRGLGKVHSLIKRGSSSALSLGQLAALLEQLE